MMLRYQELPLIIPVGPLLIYCEHVTMPEGPSISRIHKGFLVGGGCEGLVKGA